MKLFVDKIKHWYGDMQLQSKFTIALGLAVAIPAVLLGIVLYGRLYEMVVSYTIRQEQDTSAKTSPKIDEIVAQVTDAADALKEDPFYDTLFKKSVDTSFSELAVSAEAGSFCSAAKTLADGSLVTAIRIYVDLPEDSLLFSSSGTKELFAPEEEILGTYWHGIFEGSSNTSLFCPAFYLGTQEKESYGDLAYIRKANIHFHNQIINSYIAVYYSSESLTQILRDNLSLDGSVSYIVNERNSLVAASDGSLAGIYWLGYETIEDSFMSSNNFIERTILGQKIYSGFYRISQPGWFMVTILPSKPLIAQSNQWMMRFFLLYLVFLVLAMLFASRLARSITGRISSVILQMQTVRHGPPVPMDSPEYHDEIGELIDTYNYMTRKMNQLLEKQAQAAEDLRIAEFNSLQAQINPHFLYNTMDMINWMARQGLTSEVTQAVQSLSRFYKLTLSHKKSISTIAQEEEHVSIYIHLQNMRYHNRIRFISDIPDELMQYQIPKLTLQPVVENSILHGILETADKAGTIVLTGWMEDEDIVLLLSDDGVGIPQEKLATILTGTGQSTGKGTNIAIYNIHRRLQILYGEKYGLTYESEPANGTEVTIRIPAQKPS